MRDTGDDTHLVFVYGTLKSDFHNNHLLETAEFVGEDRTRDHGYTMYAVSSRIARFCPAVRDGGEHAVTGELYRVDARILAALDELEDNGATYLRREIDLHSGAVAWLYFHIDDAETLLPDASPVHIDTDTGHARWIRTPESIKHEET